MIFDAALVSYITIAVYWINQAPCNQDPSPRGKASKYFASKTEKDSDVEIADVAMGKSAEKSTGKRKFQKGSKELEDDKKSLPAKKISMVEEDDEEDFVSPSRKKTPVKPPPSKKSKVESSVEASGKTVGVDEDDEDRMDEDVKTPSKTAGRGRGRGRGGRGAGAAPGGRGRGGGGRGFNFGERKDPPHKGEKVTLFSFLSEYQKLKCPTINCLLYFSAICRKSQRAPLTVCPV
jgi:replication factor C subunit 1